MNKKEKVKIKTGDRQPFPCKKCEDFHGYQVSDLLRISYTTLFTEDGAQGGGFYSESRTVIHEGKRAYCANCGGFLCEIEQVFKTH